MQKDSGAGALRQQPQAPVRPEAGSELEGVGQVKKVEAEGTGGMGAGCRGGGVCTLPRVWAVIGRL